jgi:hypothetical protein
MEGITVLNTFTYVSPIFLLPLGLSIALSIIMIVGIVEDDPSWFFAWLLAVVFGVISYGVYHNNKVERFEALVEPSIPVEEFYDTYQLIERKGDIWVLEPLEGEDHGKEDI